MRLKILLFLAVACLAFDTASSTVVACYLGTWAAYRPGDGNFGIGNIDPKLCTHLIYTFVGIDPSDGSVIILDRNLDIDRGKFLAFNALKQQNTNLKTLLAVGGWNQGSINYSNMAANSTQRANFISSALALVNTYGFDGFDLDWEYPADRGGFPIDKENFVILIREFREKFETFATENNRETLLLTAAVSASESSVDRSYDVPQLSRYLDYIFVMAYDFHGAWDSVTGQNAPLFASSLPGASSSIPFNVICEYKLQGGWTEVWDDEQKVPYMYKGNQWITFDNQESIAYKVALAKTLNLAGVMTWSIETDDFHGKCGTKFAILKTLNNAADSNDDLDDAVGDEDENDAKDDPDQDDESESEDENDNETTLVCTSSSQLLADPNNCSKFYQCTPAGDGTYNLVQLSCNPGLYFDPSLQACNWQSMVPCAI